MSIWSNGSRCGSVKKALEGWGLGVVNCSVCSWVVTLCSPHRNADGLYHSNSGIGLDRASSIRGESVVLKPCLVPQDTSGSTVGPRCSLTFQPLFLFQGPGPSLVPYH